MAGEQLSSVLAGLKDFVNYLNMDEQDLQDKSEKLGLVLDELISQGTALIVAKEKIAENGDYNLSGERYREGAATLSQFPHVALCDICEINPDTASPTELYPDSFFNYIDISCVENGSGNFLGANKVATAEAPSRARRAVKQEDVQVSTVRPNLKAFAILSEVPDRAIASTGFAVLRAKAERLLSGFLIVMLRHEKSIDQMVGIMGKGAYPSINQSDVESIRIPLPPLEVQKEIVAEIEAYQKVINSARAVLDNYRPHIAIHRDWPMVKLESVTTIVSGYNFDSKCFSNTNPIKCIKIANVGVQEFIVDSENNLPLELYEKHPEVIVHSGDLVIALTRSIISSGLKVAIVPKIYDGTLLNQRVALIRAKKGLSEIKFIYFSLCSKASYNYVEEKARSLMQPNLSVVDLKTLEIPFPSLETQQALVAEIEAEQALVAANRELITRFEKKIQATLARVWGEEQDQENTSD